jgi:hypothetical protein
MANELILPESTSQMIAGFSVGLEVWNRVLHAGTLYDRMICDQLKKGSYGENLAMELMIDDARYAADLLRPVFERSRGRDGWVILPVSPMLLSDATETAEAVTLLHAETGRANIMISIPGLPLRLPVVQRLIETGIPVHICMIFSQVQFCSAVQTCLEAIETRIAAGLQPISACCLTIPVDRLFAGLSFLFSEEVAVEFTNAVIAEISETADNLGSSRRWGRAVAAGAQLPRLIWSFAENPNRCRSSFSLVRELGGTCSVAPRAGDAGSTPLLDPGQKDQSSAGRGPRKGTFYPALIDIDFVAFAGRLQKDQADLWLRSWIGLLDTIARKSAALTIGQSAKATGEDL